MLKPFIMQCIVLHQKQACFLHFTYITSLSGNMVLYMPYMLWLASTICPGGLYTFFAHYISCYWHISLNTYGYHIANEGYNIFILYKQIDATCIYVPKHNQLEQLPDMLLPCITPETKMLPAFYIYYISFREYGIIHATYDVTSINHVPRRAVYILCTLHFMLLAYITQHIWLSHCKWRLQYLHSVQADRCNMHICAQTQSTRTATWHVTAIYVPQINMSAKCYIYHVFEWHIWGMHVHLWHWKLLASTMLWPQRLHLANMQNWP